MPKIAIIAIAVLLIAGGVILFLPSPATSPTPEDVTASSTQAVATTTPSSSVIKTPSKSVKTTSGTTVKPSTSSNQVLSPAGGEKWVTRESHTIQWKEESLGNGVIYLLDAATKSIVGVITPSLVLHQKTFTWNTRDVSVSRGGGQKKDVAPGDYIIRIVFEVGNKPSIDSGVFSIIYGNQKTVASQTVIISNYIATPKQVTVKRGDVVYVVNNDSIEHKLSRSGFSPFVVGGGQTAPLETASLSAGVYEFYSPQYAGLKFVVAIQ